MKNENFLALYPIKCPNYQNISNKKLLYTSGLSHSGLFTQNLHRCSPYLHILHGEEEYTGKIPT